MQPMLGGKLRHPIHVRARHLDGAFRSSGGIDRGLRGCAGPPPRRSPAFRIARTKASGNTAISAPAAPPPRSGGPACPASRAIERRRRRLHYRARTSFHGLHQPSSASSKRWQGRLGHGRGDSLVTRPAAACPGRAPECGLAVADERKPVRYFQSRMIATGGQRGSCLRPRASPRHVRSEISAATRCRSGQPRR